MILWYVPIQVLPGTVYRANAFSSRRYRGKRCIVRFYRKLERPTLPIRSKVCEISSSFTFDDLTLACSSSAVC